MAGTTREVFVAEKCSKCNTGGSGSAEVGREGIVGGKEGEVAVVEEQTVVEDWGVVENSVKSVVDIPESAKEDGKIKDYSTPGLEEGFPSSNNTESADLVAIGKEIIKTNAAPALASPENLREKILRARKNLEMEAARNTYAREGEEWEVVDGEELNGREWENGNGDVGKGCFLC